MSHSCGNYKKYHVRLIPEHSDEFCQPRSSHHGQEMVEIHIVLGVGVHVVLHDMLNVPRSWSKKERETSIGSYSVHPRDRRHCKMTSIVRHTTSRQPCAVLFQSALHTQPQHVESQLYASGQQIYMGRFKYLCVIIKKKMNTILPVFPRGSIVHPNHLTNVNSKCLSV